MFLLIVLVLGLLSMVFWKKIEECGLEILGGVMITASILFACIFMVSYSTSLGTIANMEAFYERNHSVYTQAVKEFPHSGKVITKNDATNVITLPYDKVKVIVAYNEDLTWYRKYQDNWFISGFVGKVSDDLNYIVPPQ